MHLSLEYEPHGFFEGLGDKLHIVEKQAEGDLGRFKAFVESEGYATGAWRGSINEGGSVGTPGVEQAAVSLGDSGKAGVSGAAVVAGAAVLAGGAAAAAAATKSAGPDAPAEEPYPPIEPADYGTRGDQAVFPSTTTTDSPLPAPGRANVVYPTDPEAVQPPGGLEPDLDPDQAARRRGETLGGNVAPNPMG